MRNDLFVPQEMRPAREAEIDAIGADQGCHLRHHLPHRWEDTTGLFTNHTVSVPLTVLGLETHHIPNVIARKTQEISDIAERINDGEGLDAWRTHYKKPPMG